SRNRLSSSLHAASRKPKTKKTGPTRFMRSLRAIPIALPLFGTRQRHGSSIARHRSRKILVALQVTRPRLCVMFDRAPVLAQICPRLAGIEAGLGPVVHSIATQSLLRGEVLTRPFSCAQLPANSHHH